MREAVPEPEKRQGGIAWISTTLSAIALIVSLLSLYFSVFYVSDEVSARLVSVDTGGEERKIYAVEVAVSNTGNRPAILASITLMLGRNESAPDQALVLNPNQLPLLLPAHEVRLVRLELPIRDAIDKRFGSTASAARNAERFVFLAFRTIASDARMVEYISPPLYSVRMVRGEIQRGVGALENDEPVFDLLKISSGSRERSRNWMAS